jgi:hypothetical protein
MEKLGNGRRRTETWFGNLAIVVFLLTQASDGVLTYLGVGLYGVRAEGNPLISWLIASVGPLPALATAKLVAGFFGVVLHVSAVHRAVAALAVFYLAVAVVPWMVILLYGR